MLWLSLFVLICTLVVAVRSILGFRSITRLADVAVGDATDESWPSVSIVVAARNEQRDMEPAILSLLRIDYPKLEVIAVNDRSTDDTGYILDTISRDDSKLRVVHVQELPDGWLGKNHALHIGAASSVSEFLLFTDADVVLESSSLRRAIRYMMDRRLDHLTATPQLEMPGWLLDSFATTFAICFFTYFPPWQARQANRPTAVGIGAFNLVRRKPYQAIGGHEPIRMRPDDDVRLASALKQSECRQDVVIGKSMIRVPWYRTVSEVIVGLEKNTFSGVDYSILTTVAAASALLLLSVWPFVALCATSGWTWWVYVIQCGVLIGFAAWVSQIVGVAMRSCVLHPISVGLIVFIMLRTMFLTFRNDGIVWRGTHYRLADLKSNTV